MATKKQQFPTPDSDAEQPAPTVTPAQGSQSVNVANDTVVVRDQNGDHVAIIEPGDADHVHMTMGGSMYRISHDTAKKLIDALGGIVD